MQLFKIAVFAMFEPVCAENAFANVKRDMNHQNIYQEQGKKVK